MEHGINKILKTGNYKFPEINSKRPNELVHEVSFETYHGDLSAISSSGVRMLLRSPMHFVSWLINRDNEEEEKDYFRFGRAAHMALLEPAKFKDSYIIEPIFEAPTKDGKMSTRSKEAVEKREKWRAELDADSLVITEQEMQDLTGMIDSVMSHSVARNLLVDGRPEVSGWWTEPETGVLCRIRPDYLSTDSDGNIHLIDFKTTIDARTGMFSESIYKYMYHVQMAFYYDGIKEILKKEPATASFIAIDKKSPYSCGVYICDDNMLEMGRQWYKYALQLYSQCIKRNQWPGIQTQAQMISLPRRAEFDAFPQFQFEE